MSDGLGVVRRVHPLFAAFVGDYPEQVLVTGVKSGDCPKCNVSFKELGNPQAPSNLRDIHAVHDLLSKRQVNYQDYVRACKGLRFKPIPDPFWAQLPFIDIFQAITPDILHQLLQGVLKHVIKWLVKAYGSAKIDARCQRLVPNHHIRIFKGGISWLSRVTGKEHSMMGHIILGVIADMSLPNGFDSARLLWAVCALLDFLFIAQLPIISTRHLAIMEQALDTFHKNKQIFVDLGIRDKFNIPKLHALLHYAHSMQLFGTTDNYDTQYTKRLHRNLAKDPYRGTNMRDELPQMTNCVERHEKVERHTEYITWRDLCPDSNLQTPSQSPLLRLAPSHRYIMMTKYPNVQTISIEDVITQYSAEFFYGAFARYAVLWRHQQKNQQIMPARLEQDILDIHIPFTHISVYHYIRFREDTIDGPVVDSVRIRPHKKDRKGQTIAGRFDTGLIYSGKVDEAAAGFQGTSSVQCQLYHNDLHYGVTLAYYVAQIRVIFSINPRARQLLFGQHKHPPEHLAYVEWFTPFQRNPESKTGLYKVSRMLRHNARVASIIPVTSIRQSIHLSPLPGRTIPRDWNSNTILNNCNTFLVNSFTDSHTYLLFHGPK